MDVLVVLLLALSFAACVPDEADDESLVAEPRVLAVRMEPAEVAPRGKLHVSALFAGSDVNDVDWAFCVQRKPLSELGPISKTCLPPDGKGLEVFATGLDGDAAMPPDACRSFGPDRPAPKAGEPAGRPVDADPSGGYYQPIALFDYESGGATLFEARVSCALPGVTRELFADWNRRYVPNRNPEIDALELLDGSQAQPLDPELPLAVREGETLDLRVRAVRCAGEVDAAESCSGAEAYLYYDRDADELTTRVETLRASWFADAGSFRDSRTGLAPRAGELRADNRWTAPRDEREVQLWVVLRDDRGGVAWRSYRLAVGP